MARRWSALPGWLLSDLPPVLRLAATLTGSTPGAVELAATTLAADRSWRDADQGYDLTPRLRTAIVRAFLASPLGRSRPPAVATGLDALTGPVRAAVVLRDAERLTGSEIATIMDRPGRRVAGELAAIPPGVHDGEIAQLTALAPDPADVAYRFPTVQRTITKRRRLRTVLATIAVFALGVAVVVPTVVIPRLPHETRPAGQWRYSHEVRLADGWQIRYRSITDDTEQTALAVPWLPDEPIHCLVTVTTVGVEPRRSGPVQPTTVGGRPGVLVDQPGNDLALQWQYADAAWADIQCPGAAVTEEVLREVADRVRFTDNRQLLPFTLTALPDQYRIRMVASVDEDPDWGPTMVLDPPNDSYWPVLLIGPHTSDGEPSDGIERCLDPTNTICVTAAQSDDQVPVNLNIQRRVLAETVGLVQLAPDLTDRSTWFDAITLPAS